MDRHFCPKDSTSEDHKAAFLTCPPTVCSDPEMRKLLESKPLVTSMGGKKLLETPDPIFSKDQVSFKEMPLFAFTQHHAKLSLANIAAMSQVCLGVMITLLEF